jgi:hypothetical protein
VESTRRPVFVSLNEGIYPIAPDNCDIYIKCHRDDLQLKQIVLQQKFLTGVPEKYTITTKLSQHIKNLNVTKNIKQHYFLL